MDISELVKRGEIEFYSQGKKLDTNISDLGIFNGKLLNHLHTQADDYVKIRGGSELVEFLSGLKATQKYPGLYDLAQDLVRLWGHNTERRFHVDVDIGDINKKILKENIILKNGLNQIVADATEWGSGLLYSEKIWNWALCSAIGGFIGYPGYEWPNESKSFEYEVQAHAQWFLIGTKDQLGRYQRLIDKSTPMQFSGETHTRKEIKKALEHMNLNY